MNYKELFSKHNSIATMLGILLLSTSPALVAQFVEPPPPPKVVDKAHAEVAQTDSGLEIPVDGSSLESFEASIAEIKESASEANYTTLEHAIQYLLVYDLGAGRNKAKLAKNLDGMTGAEIIAQVNVHKRGK